MRIPTWCEKNKNNALAYESRVGVPRRLGVIRRFSQLTEDGVDESVSRDKLPSPNDPRTCAVIYSPAAHVKALYGGRCVPTLGTGKAVHEFRRAIYKLDEPPVPQLPCGTPKSCTTIHEVGL